MNYAQNAPYENQNSTGQSEFLYLLICEFYSRHTAEFLIVNNN